jgi:23S rRNA (pseudouridine1915-N3)-methyltransferase
MRVILLAVGRMKKGPETELVARYLKRAEQAGRQIGLRGVEIIEIKESRASDAGKRMIEESIALANLIPDGAVAIMLDETGESFASAAFADHVRKWRDAGVPAAVFIIGGPDGLAQSLRDKAKLKLAFGTATWPHQMVRIMLLEQIYRAITILSGHPYHRE